MGLVEKIGALLKAKKKCTTIADTLNTSHVPPLFGNTWHHTAVRLIARRARLIKTVTVTESALAESAETLTTPTPCSTAPSRAADAIHPIEDAPFKTRGHSHVRKKVSRKRKQRRKPAQKSRHNAPPRNKLPKKTLKKARIRRKTSKAVSTKAASLSKTLRHSKATKKASLKRSVSKRGKKRAQQASRVRVKSARRKRQSVGVPSAHQLTK
jgi:hypothetical protein